MTIYTIEIVWAEHPDDPRADTDNCVLYFSDGVIAHEVYERVIKADNVWHVHFTTTEIVNEWTKGTKPHER